MKKKMTAGNRMTIFDVVKKKGRDVIDFPEGPQSFYRIMTHYVAGLNFVPEDGRHKHLQQDLFTFVMKNVDYTKVKIVLCEHIRFKLLVEQLVILKQFLANHNKKK